MVERVFGSLKQRYRNLNTCVPYKIVDNSQIIKACAVVHNFLGRLGKEMLISNPPELVESGDNAHDPN